jgi:hypothetical protein
VNDSGRIKVSVVYEDGKLFPFGKVEAELKQQIEPLLPEGFKWSFKVENDRRIQLAVRDFGSPGQVVIGCKGGYWAKSSGWSWTATWPVDKRKIDPNKEVVIACAKEVATRLQRQIENWEKDLAEVQRDLKSLRTQLAASGARIPSRFFSVGSMEGLEEAYTVAGTDLVVLIRYITKREELNCMRLWSPKGMSNWAKPRSFAKMLKKKLEDNT